MSHPKVFISYSHDSEEHRRRVLALSDKLRSQGVDCNLDQYEMAPPGGWPRWMREQVRESDFVLVVCTEAYERRYDGTEAFGTGAGVKWEGAIITQQLYEAEGENTKFIPVVFSPHDLRHVPLEMRGGTSHRLDDEAGYESLYRRLTGQPLVVKGELGNLRILPAASGRHAPAAHPGAQELLRLKTPASDYSPRHLLSYVNFTHRYFEHLVYKYRTYRTQGVMTKGPFTLDLEKVFISLRVGPESPNTASSEMIRKETGGKDFSVWDFLARLDGRAPHRQHMVVLGAPGSGKSTLLEHLALTYALGTERRQHPKAPRLIPFLLHLRDIRNVISADDPPNLVELVERQEFWRKLDPPPRWFEGKLRQKKCLVMLDGLDEVADEAQRKRVSSWVSQQLAAYPTPFILTSRPFGYTSAPVENVGVSLEVQPFNFAEVEQFIQNWYLQNEIMSQVRREDPGVREEAEAKARDLVARVKGSPPLAAMAVNPLLLTMIATIHAIRAVLPGKRVELYAEICDVLLGRRQEAKGILDPLTSIQQRSVLQVLALALMQRKTREFTLDLGCSLIGEILSSVTSEGETDPRAFIEQVQNVSGLIVEKSLGVYEFAHQSFQEYLAAVQVKATNQDALLVRNVHDSWWSETIRLYAAQGDATELIRTALEKPSVVALTIASDCLEEAAIIASDVRRQLERTLREGIESEDPLIARMAAEVKLALRLNRLKRVDDDIEMDAGSVTCAEYQLFTDEMLKAGQYRQPDHWDSTRFKGGEGDVPVAGVRATDAADFCEWLNRTHAAPGHLYRLPTPEEEAARPVENRGVLSWCGNSGWFVLAGPDSDDRLTWQNLTSIYARVLKHVFGQDLELGSITHAASNFILHRAHDLGEAVSGAALPDAQQLLGALTRHKVHADYLCREMDVNVSNVLPLTAELAAEIGIEVPLARDLLERELDGLIGEEDSDPELSRRLRLARRLSRDIGRARLFAEELSADLMSVQEMVTASASSSGLDGFGGCCFMTRAPACDRKDDRPRLLLNYFLSYVLDDEWEGWEEELLGFYLCIVLVGKRAAAQLSAWEGIRLVRERVE